MSRIEPSRRWILVCLLGLLGGACRARSDAPPKLGQVPAFALTDQDGRAFTEQTLAKKTWVAAFMFTRCPTVCPRITQKMKQLQAKSGEKLWLVSVSVDPEHDTPAVLREYALKNGAKLASWSFLTGDSEVIQKTAELGFKLAVEGKFDANAPDRGLLHGSHLVLVDGTGQIRGFYRTDDDAELERLLSDAEHLG